MNRLSKDQQEEKDRIETELRERHSKLEDAIEQFNLTLDQEWQKVQEAVDAYNAQVSEAGDFCTAVESDIEAYVSDKSDKWQEGDRGQAFLSWQEAWTHEPEEIDLEKPDELGLPESGADEFGELPTEPDL